MSNNSSNTLPSMADLQGLYDLTAELAIIRLRVAIEKDERDTDLSETSDLMDAVCETFGIDSYDQVDKPSTLQEHVDEQAELQARGEDELFTVFERAREKSLLALAKFGREFNTWRLDPLAFPPEGVYRGYNNARRVLIEYARASLNLYALYNGQPA